ncbi:MAG TPA: PAS domain S-box protein [Chryseosolibacter sp.]
MTSILHSQLKKEAVTVSLLPTLKFVAIGIIWIVLSDLALFLSQASVSTHFPIFHLEVLKGTLFVLAMGVFFFMMQRKNDSVHREIAELDLFQRNPQAMMIYNLQTMQFLDVNEAAVGVYGYTRAEFLSMKICDIRLKEELPTLIKAIEQLQNGFRFIGDSRHIHKNGSIVHTEVSAYSITYKKQHAGLIMAIDISNQKKAEQALIEATKLHEQQMHAKLYEVALFNKELQVRIREINANNDELIEVNKLLQHASRNSVARYEAKVLRMQQLMTEALENMSEAFWIIDLKTAEATFASAGALSYFGCSRKCLVDRPNLWESFVHSKDKKRIKEEMLQLNDHDELEIQYLHQDGITRISQKIRLIRDEDEAVEKIMCAVRIPESPTEDLFSMTTKNESSWRISESNR